MREEWIRTVLLIGKEGLERLQNTRVAVFGIGGVGGFSVEALARAGIGKLDLIDNDIIMPSNINRQIIATQSSIGRYKVDVMKERVLDINPECEVKVYTEFYLPENKNRFDFSLYDYVVDAIDTVTGKIGLVLQAQEVNTPIISSMGAGNKLDPTRFEVTDIYKTSICPLARVMRRELKKRGVKKLKVVYSKEEAVIPYQIEEENRKESPKHRKRQIPGSISFVPSVVGLMIAGEIVQDVIKKIE